MTTFVPFFKDVPGLTKFLTDFVANAEADRRNTLSGSTANHSLLLRSPAGKVYEITVNDAGVLVSTLVQG